MNREEYFKFHKEFCDKMYQICINKNNDYAGDTNPFSNFEKAELLGICSNEAGFLVRIMDKISRVISFINKGELLVKDESVTDSLMDLANYAILLAGYIESKKKEQYKQITIFNQVDIDILNFLNTEFGYLKDDLFDELLNSYNYHVLEKSFEKLLNNKFIEKFENNFRTVSKNERN